MRDIDDFGRCEKVTNQGLKSLKRAFEKLGEMKSLRLNFGQ